MSVPPIAAPGAPVGASFAVAAPGTTAGGAAAAPARSGEGKPSKEAESFERVLLGQLTRTLAESAFGDDEEASAAGTAYRDMLPDALSETLAAGGGIGLARALDAGPLA